MTLAAARAADPDDTAAALLLGPEAGRATPEQWAAPLGARLAKRLHCYRMLLDKLTLMTQQASRLAHPPSATSASQATPPAGD